MQVKFRIGPRMLRLGGRLCRKPVLVLLLCVTAQIAYSSPLERRTTTLWHAYHRTLPDSPAKAVDLLLELRQTYRYLLRPAAVDSASDMLLELLRGRGDERLKMSAGDRWFAEIRHPVELPDAFPDSTRAASFLGMMMRVANRSSEPLWYAQAWCASAQYELSRGRAGTAALHMNKAWQAATQIEETALRIRCLLLLGYCEERQFRKLDAFRHYADALYIARELDDPDWLARCYEHFFDFYNALGNYKKADEYLHKAFPMLLRGRPVDSVALMSQMTNLVFLRCSLQEFDAAIRAARYVLEYSIRNGNLYLKKPVFITLKSMLMEHGQYQRLKDFYLTYYPEELARAKTSEPIVYYQLMAAFAEADTQPDTARKYYELVRQEIFAAPRTAGARSFFLRRYGQFLLRQHDVELARPMLDSALRYAETIRYLPYMTELSSQLDSIAAAQGNMAEAYRYAKLNLRYTAELNRTNRQDEILMLDLENELRSRELLARQEEIRKHHRHNVQYMAITMLIGLSFLVLLLLGSFKVPRWAITGMGFFSFIFFFEFIILLIDHKVHELTHGEPWKILAIKIVIIAGLLPLHHWLEHKVVSYLQTHKMIDPQRFSLAPIIQRLRLARRPATPQAKSTGATASRTKK